MWQVIIDAWIIIHVIEDTADLCYLFGSICWTRYDLKWTGCDFIISLIKVFDDTSQAEEG